MSPVLALRCGAWLALPACMLALPRPLSAAGLPPAPPIARAAVAARMARLPLAFEPNRGQFGPSVRFAGRGGDANLLLANDGVAVGRVRMRLVGANRNAAAVGVGRLPGVVNYLLGRDRSKWRTGIPTYSQVRFAGVYSGTDLVYYGNQQRLEYDFVLRPGADPARIRVAFEGAVRLAVAANGDLVVHARGGDLRWKRPYAYQQVGARRVRVACAYTVAPGDHTVCFMTARYDRSRPLVVDPTLDYCTYLGGSNSDTVNSVAIDSSGQAVVTGQTASIDFPLLNELMPADPGASVDAFVTKFNLAGSSVLFSTYFGGSDSDYGYRVALDSTDSIYITGLTRSTDFPVSTGALKETLGGYSDRFVTKLTSNGIYLTYSTYLGGSAFEEGTGCGLAVDSYGQAVVAVPTTSVDYPILYPCVQPTMSQGPDVAISTLSADGTWLVASTFWGGSGTDTPCALALGSSGDVYVAGYTTSSDLPTTSGAYRRTRTSAQAGMLMRFNSDYTLCKFSTLVEATNATASTSLLSVLPNSDGSAYFCGATDGATYPVTAGVYQSSAGGGVDGVLGKISGTGAALQYSTRLGGAGSDYLYRLARTAWGDITAVGYTTSSGLATTADALKAALGGTTDMLVGVFDPTLATAPFLSYLGGTGADRAFDCAMQGNMLVVAGDTTGGAPVTASAYRRTFAGITDGLVARTTLAPPAGAIAVAAVSGQIGTAVTLSATLTFRGVALSGKTVAFTVAGTSVGTGTTNASGVATRSYTIPSGWTTGSQSIGASFAGDATAGACSNTGTLTVQAITTTLTAAGASAEAGQSVTLSATLKAGATALSGKTIAFTVGGVAAGSATTNASGVASVAYPIASGATPGTQAIGASYGGDSTYAASSGSATLTVEKTTSALAAAAASGTPGETVTLSATLTSGGSALSGRTVAFTAAGASAGSASTNASGVASVTYTIPLGTTIGSYSIGAEFAGDSLYKASSGSAGLTVNYVATTLALADASVEIWQQATLTATLQAGATPLQGKSVTFYYGSDLVGTKTTKATGQATCVVGLPFGTTLGAKTISARFGGDTLYGGSSSTATLTVGKNTTALTVGDASGQPGQVVSISATLAAGAIAVEGQSVAFVVNGSSAGSATTNASGVATLSYTVPAAASSGSQAIQASFAGADLHKASSGSATLTVEAISTSLAVGDASGEPGQSVQLTATLKSGSTALAGRSIAFTVGGSAAGSGDTDSTGAAVVSYTVPAGATPGVLAVGAAFAGDAQHASSSGAGSFEVLKRTTSLAVADASARSGQSATLSATLKAGGVGVEGQTVAFTVAGSSVGSATTNAEGTAAISYTVPNSAAAGNLAIGASYAGDNLRKSSSGSGTLTVQADPTSLAVADAQATVGGTAALGATLTCAGAPVAGKTVSFTVDGSAVGDVLTDVSGVATLSYSVPAGATSGNHTVGAAFAGGSGFGASTGSGTLALEAMATSLSVSNASGDPGSSVTLSATLTSGGSGVAGKTVRFVVAGNAAGTGTTGADGTATLVYTIPVGVNVGESRLGAEFDGDASCSASAGWANLHVNGTAADLAVAMPSRARGAYGTLTATLTSLGVGIAGKSIAFSFGSVSVGAATTDADGVARLDYLVPVSTTPGAVTIDAYFGGDTVYYAASATGATEVTDGQVPGMGSAQTQWGQGVPARLYCYLFRPGSPLTMLTGRTVRFSVDGVEKGTAVTDSSGCASLSVSGLQAGTWPVLFRFDGDADYRACSFATSVVINSGAALVLYVGDQPHGSRGVTVPLYAYVKRATDGVLLPGLATEFLVDGVSAGSATTDATGMATVQYTVPAGAGIGSHTITARHAYDGTYALGTGSGTLTVAAREATGMFVNDFKASPGAQVKLYAYLWRKSGKAMLAGKTVQFKVNGTVVGSAVSNSTGYAQVTHTVKSGDTTILAEFAGDAGYAASNATGKITNP